MIYSPQLSKVIFFNLRLFYKMLLRFMLLLLLTACSLTNEEKKVKYVIPGRHHESFYEIEVPQYWTLKLPEGKDYQLDSKIALCEFFIDDPEGQIRITIHNFINSHLSNRIPPMQQTERWKKQFQKLNYSTTEPLSYGGFVGLVFEATGILNNALTTTLAWSLQLDEFHYNHLNKLQAYSGAKDYQEMQADVTIKAQGPAVLIEKYKEDLTQTAWTFKFIQDIPAPL